MSLVTILAEYIEPRSRGLTISKDDRDYIKKHYALPDHWSIFAISINSGKWFAQYEQNARNLTLYQERAEFFAKMRETGGVLPRNAQVSSLGIGKVFFQVFVSPAHLMVGDFRRAAKRSGLVQIWPLPRSLWPFKEGTAKFPTKLVLDDEGADFLAHAFDARLKTLRALPKEIR